MFKSNASFAASAVLGSARDIVAPKLLGPVFAELYIWTHTELLQATHNPDFKFNGSSGAQVAKDNIMEEMGLWLS